MLFHFESNVAFHLRFFPARVRGLGVSRPFGPGRALFRACGAPPSQSWPSAALPSLPVSAHSGDDR